MSWKLTVRAGSLVERRRLETLDQVLRAVESRGDELARDAPKAPIDARYKRFTPIEQVVARIEIAGPQRLIPTVRAGVDVRGDGSTEAYLGRIRRELVKQRSGESAYKALRRALAATGIGTGTGTGTA